MRLQKISLISIVFTFAICLAFPTGSFACWATGDYMYECCWVCCEDADDCYNYYYSETASYNCRFNWYCAFNPIYCSSSESCPGGDCFTSFTLDNDETKLDILREARDTKLASTALGVSLVALYYEHTEEISDILLADEDLLAIATNVLNEIVDKTVFLNNDEEVSIDRELVERILELADLISENASPSLRIAIKKVKKEIKRGNIFKQLGITISESMNHDVYPVR